MGFREYFATLWRALKGETLVDSAYVLRAFNLSRDEKIEAAVRELRACRNEAEGLIRELKAEIQSVGASRDDLIEKHDALLEAYEDMRVELEIAHARNRDIRLSLHRFAEDPTRMPL